MGMITGNRIINQIVAGSMSGAQLQTSLGTASNLASFKQSINNRAMARILAESVTGLTAVSASSLACRAVGDSLVASSAMLASHTVRGEVMTRSPLAARVLSGPLGPVAEPHTIWRNRSTPAGPNTIWGNGIAVSVSGINIYSSTDMVTWTPRTNPNATTVSRKSAIAYGNGVFVAVSNDGSSHTKAMTSPDGITWTARTLPANYIWRFVVFTGTHFTAMGSSGNVMYTSLDGVSWASTPMTMPVDFVEIIYGNGIYLGWAAGGASQAFALGGTWSSTAAPGSNNIYGFGGGYFVAMNASTGNNIAAYSQDGFNWTQTPAINGPANTIEYSGGVFYAANQTTQGAYWISNDFGVTWKLRIAAAFKGQGTINGISRGDGPLILSNGATAVSHG